MKKVFSMVLILVLVATLMSCGNDEDSTKDAAIESAESEIESVADVESVVGSVYELYKTNYGEDKPATMEIIYTFKEDGSVDINLGGTDMNKPFTQEGADITIDYGANGGIEELKIIEDELVKDLGYGKEFFRKK